MSVVVGIKQNGVWYLGANRQLKAFPLAVMNKRDCKLETWEK